MAGQLMDAVVTPIVGHQIDKKGRLVSFYGRRKTWHLIGEGLQTSNNEHFGSPGTAVVCGSFPFIFHGCFFEGCSSWSQTAQAFYYSIFILVFQFGWASVQISHLSLIPVLAHNQKDITSLTAYRFVNT